MPRVIKFRAWNTNSEEMISWGQMGDDHWDLWNEFRYCDTMMQFTGIQDTKGNDIYEGDIIMFLDRDWTDYEKNTKRLPVQYLGDRFILIDTSMDGYGEFAGYDLYKSYGRDRFEVIGNIYEHPHLLNQTK